MSDCHNSFIGLTVIIIQTIGIGFLLSVGRFANSFVSHLYHIITPPMSWENTYDFSLCIIAFWIHSSSTKSNVYVNWIGYRQKLLIFNKACAKWHIYIMIWPTRLSTKTAYCFANCLHFYYAVLVPLELPFHKILL